MMIVTVDFSVSGDRATDVGGAASLENDGVTMRLATVSDGRVYFRRTLRIDERTFTNAVAKGTERVMTDLRNCGLQHGEYGLLCVKAESA